jgi:2'-5' RNA ligase
VLGRALALVLDDARLAAVRERFYPEAVARGLPLHMTVLYPFAGPVEPAREVVTGQGPLRFALTRLGVFHGGFAVVFPEPQEELRALQRAVWARFQESPPYGGEVADPEPHVTLGRDVPLRELRTAVEPLLPVECRVDAVTLLEEYKRDRWHQCARLDFGCSPGDL